MVDGLKEKMKMGRNAWYDDLFCGVPKNSQGEYDQHADLEGDSEDIDDNYEQVMKEYMDEQNPEGYLGEVTGDGLQRLYPALKEKYAIYERNISLVERPPPHQFRTGDLVVLSSEYRDLYLARYSKDHPLPRKPNGDSDSEIPINDAYMGPLQPEDVGVVLEDDCSHKPYLVKSLHGKCLKEDYPPYLTDRWWYIPAALVRYDPPPEKNLPYGCVVRVPEDFPSIKRALMNVSEGHEIEVSHGEYRFEEVFELGEHPDGECPLNKYPNLRTLVLRGQPRHGEEQAELDAEGAWGAEMPRSFGRFVMGRCSKGQFSFMSMLYTSLNSYRGIIEAHGGPWEFFRCQLRCGGGVAILGLSEAQVTAAECGLGGFAWPIGPHSASDGVRACGRSEITLESCTIDKTGRVGGVGVMAVERSEVSMVDCRFHQNDHAVGYNDHATVLMYNCTIRGCRSEALYGGLKSLDTTLLMRRCFVDGPVWFRRRLPGTLGLSDDYPGDNIMGPIPPKLREPFKGFPDDFTTPLLDDRLVHRQVAVPIHYDSMYYSGG